MAIDFDPVVGNWYEHVDKGQKFEVVSIDEDSGMVEIQYYDGDIEDIDYEAWYELDLEPSEPPDEWTGPIADADDEEVGFTEPETEEDWEEKPRRGRSRKRSGKDQDDDEEEDDDADYGSDEWEE